MSHRPTDRLLTISGIMLVWWVLASISVTAQTDTISGVINRYTNAVYIECTNNSSIVVRDPYGFKVGDKILIIQMKGAEISTANDSTFGDIQDYHDAGNYELATIDEIHDKSFVLHDELARSYSVSDIVQVIRVPTYTNVLISDTLKAQPWNGMTGGVLAFIATDTVTMGAPIDVRGMGFAGPPYDSTTTNGVDQFDFFYPEGDTMASPKGEGIVAFVVAMRCGRGKLANGGGGGNVRGAGGGGGANYGFGGQGGDQAEYKGDSAIGGRGGAALVYNNDTAKVFLGGGSGRPGYEDLYPAVGGASGGGIIMIRASVLYTNAWNIDASGLDNTGENGDTLTVSGGGGGGGGVVLLDVGTFTDTASVVAAGGRGGDAYTHGSCYGPGGGGGGGCVWVSQNSVPPNLVTSVVAGLAGYATEIGCPDSTHGSTAAGDGGVLTGLQIPEGTVPR